jgi:hypothetical protein
MNLFLNDESAMLVLPSLNVSLNFANTEIKNLEYTKLTKEEILNILRLNKNGVLSISDSKPLEDIISVFERTEAVNKIQISAEADITPEVNLNEELKARVEDKQEELKELLLKGVNKIQAELRNNFDVSYLHQLLILEKRGKKRASLIKYLESKLAPLYKDIQDITTEKVSYGRIPEKFKVVLKNLLANLFLKKRKKESFR